MSFSKMRFTPSARAAAADEGPKKEKGSLVVDTAYINRPKGSYTLSVGSAQSRRIMTAPH